MTSEYSSRATKLKRLLIESSPYIEELTAVVCPQCTDVCCRQKHGLYQEKDILYLYALGEDVPKRDPMRPPEGRCEVMGEQGCLQPRWLRPFRCTWYFCEPLLTALESVPPKKMRFISSLLRDMSSLYGSL